MFKIVMAAAMIAAVKADDFDDILGGGDHDYQPHGTNNTMAQNTTVPVVEPIDKPSIDGNQTANMTPSAN